MPVKRIRQYKNTLKAEITETLIHLRAVVDSIQVEISRRLGYERDVLSRVTTEEDYCGSPQLLAGLKLLLELETLKRKHAPKTLREEIAQAVREEMAALSSARVDAAEIAAHALLNESNAAPSPPPIQSAPPAPPVRYRKAKRKGPPTPPASSHEA